MDYLDARLSLRILSLLVLIGVGLASCGEPIEPSVSGPVTTLVNQMAFESGEGPLPEVDVADLPANGRVDFPTLGGADLDEALAWAENTGWEFIRLVDLEASDEVFYTLEGRSPASRITITYRGTTVVEAFAG